MPAKLAGDFGLHVPPEHLLVTLARAPPLYEWFCEWKYDGRCGRLLSGGGPFWRRWSNESPGLRPQYAAPFNWLSVVSHNVPGGAFLKQRGSSDASSVGVFRGAPLAGCQQWANLDGWPVGV
jgi:hypothetical protein